MKATVLDPFTTPLYRMSEAAEYLDVPESTFRSWARGRTDTRMPSPVVTAAIGRRRGEPTVPFVGLAEGLVLAAVRRAGVPLQRIRPALDVLRKEIGLEHALASRKLFTDGAEIIYDFGQRDQESAAAVSELVVVRNGQRMFSEIVDKYLARLEFGDDNYVRLIHLPEYADLRVDVIADPTRSFGQPIFATGGTRVEDVLERIWGSPGEPLDVIAEDYGLSEADLVDVLRVASQRAA